MNNMKNKYRQIQNIYVYKYIYKYKYKYSPW